MSESPRRLLSPTALSNLYSMGVAVKKDDRQKVPTKCEMPDEATRELRARLILEEAIETINGLGFAVCVGNNQIASKSALIHLEPEFEPNMVDIIDGCCDTIYVCVGTLCACGVPDDPHLAEVNRANNAKFPNGEGIINEQGKYLKPDGWTPPDHESVIKRNMLNISSIQEELMHVMTKEK